MGIDTLVYNYIMPKKSAVPLMTIETSHSQVMNSRYGIYAYFRKDSGEMLYLGKDSNINTHARHLAHMAPSKIKEQRINAYIQTPGVIEQLNYEVLYICKDEQEMCNLETALILFYKSIGQCKLNTSIDIKPELYKEIVDNIPNIDFTYN